MAHVLTQKVVDAEESTAQRQREEEGEVAGGFPEAVSHATDATLDVIPDALLVSIFGHVLDGRLATGRTHPPHLRGVHGVEEQIGLSRLGA